MINLWPGLHLPNWCKSVTDGQRDWHKYFALRKMEFSRRPWAVEICVAVKDDLYSRKFLGFIFQIRRRSDKNVRTQQKMYYAPPSTISECERHASDSNFYGASVGAIYHAERDNILPFLSVRLSVMMLLCRNGCKHRQTFLNYRVDASFFKNITAVTKFLRKPSAWALDTWGRKQWDFRPKKNRSLSQKC